MLALANKESLVLAGDLLMGAASRSGAAILPVDSEHSGLFQCLEGRPAAEVARVFLTASGGPFRGWPRERLARVTPEEALRHPIWPMGPRITVDSATLFNKGLEVIETRALFGIPLERIKVWVHPQSAVHALVEWRDGSLLAQVSAPDMMLPVQYAMTYPERLDCEAPRGELPRWGRLDFGEPDREAFPALDLAYAAAARGGTAPTVLNAADEVAVAAFLERRLSFTAIVDVLRDTLERVPVRPAASLAAIDAADREARDAARALVQALAS
jgi:1-deoxy-D-xylulose-5-phosphate reductoisomerase